MKFLDYKNRFIHALEYIQTEKCLFSAALIKALPDEPTDECHRIYLISQMISITLNHVTWEDFDLFPHERHRIVFAALFSSKVEIYKGASLDHEFLEYEEGREEFEKQKVTLDNLIDAFFSSKDLKPLTLSDFSINPKELFKEIHSLKETCDLFIMSYDDFSLFMQSALTRFPDSLVVQDFEPEVKFEEDVFLLEEQGSDKEVIFEKNKLTIISSMRPCLGVMVAGMNHEGQLAYSAWHVSAAEYSSSLEGDYERLSQHVFLLVDKLKTTGYAQNLRFFLTGADMSTFSLVLRLLMHIQRQPNWAEIGINFHLLPSIQGHWSHCIIQSDPQSNVISIRVGAESYANKSNMDFSDSGEGLPNLSDSEEVHVSVPQVKSDDFSDDLSDDLVGMDWKKITDDISRGIFDFDSMNFFKSQGFKRNCESDDPNHEHKRLKKHDREDKDEDKDFSPGGV